MGALFINSLSVRHSDSLALNCWWQITLLFLPWLLFSLSLSPSVLNLSLSLACSPSLVANPPLLPPFTSLPPSFISLFLSLFIYHPSLCSLGSDYKRPGMFQWRPIVPVARGGYQAHPSARSPAPGCHIYPPHPHTHPPTRHIMSVARHRLPSQAVMWCLTQLGQPLSWAPQ